MPSNLAKLVEKNRSYRRFEEKSPISDKTLRHLIELARICPSAANLQPLKYYISNQTGNNQQIFSTLQWAGYLKDWSGPIAGERPSAYVIILHDRSICEDCGCDHGIVAQTILLGAVELNLGGCMIGAFNRKQLIERLNLPVHLQPRLVIALGKPIEKVVVEPINSDGNIKYWRDSGETHHVPKRSIETLICN